MNRTYATPAGQDMSASPSTLPLALVAEDDPGFARQYKNALVPDWEVQHVTSAEELMRAVETCEPDMIFLDLELAGGHWCIDDIPTVRDQLPDTPILVVSLHGEPEVISRAIQSGATWFLSKGASENVVRAAVEMAVSITSTRRRLAFSTERERLESGLSSPGETTLVGESAVMQALREEIAEIARFDVPVLITGETGTGKDVVARLIHARSPRSKRPFEVADLAWIPDTVLTSHLFGSVAGAFTGARNAPGTFAAAANGTIFLNEIGTLSPGGQAALLGVLNDREYRRVGSQRVCRVNCRIIAATNEDLESKVEDGAFREDLLHRLAVGMIHVPPLRDRGDDVKRLATHFVSANAREFGIAEPVISPEAMERLMQHPWPGNVRELENLVRRVLVHVKGSTLEPRDLEGRMLQGIGTAASTGGAAGERTSGDWRFPDSVIGLEYHEAKELAVLAFKRHYCLGLLERSGGVKSRAAATAGLRKQSFLKMLQDVEADDI